MSFTSLTGYSSLGAQALRLWFALRYFVLRSKEESLQHYSHSSSRRQQQHRNHHKHHSNTCGCTTPRHHTLRFIRRHGTQRRHPRRRPHHRPGEYPIIDRHTIMPRHHNRKPSNIRRGSLHYRQLRIGADLRIPSWCALSGLAPCLRLRAPGAQSDGNKGLQLNGAEKRFISSWRQRQELLEGIRGSRLSGGFEIEGGSGRIRIVSDVVLLGAAGSGEVRKINDEDSAGAVCVGGCGDGAVNLFSRL
jgi:hypothetical protein